MVARLQLDAAEHRPLVQAVAREVLLQLREATAELGDRVAYSEAEAAEMLGLLERQLADERRRGRIAASSIVGRRIRYLREDLVRYMLDRRIGRNQDTEPPTESIN